MKRRSASMVWGENSTRVCLSGDQTRKFVVEIKPGSFHSAARAQKPSAKRKRAAAVGMTVVA
jgi:hypothetical protein